MKNGSFIPSWILCHANTTSDKRSGWRMVKQFGKKKFNLSKVLVTSIYGHNDMIDYFSDFRTQDKLHGVHYYPRGALCWFETNQYGDFLGPVYYVRKIPAMEMLDLPLKERGYRRLLALRNKNKNTKELLTKERNDTGLIAVVKPKLHKWEKGE